MVTQRHDGEQRTALLTIDLFRHGETERNAANLFSGCVETPLTARGREQAMQIALAPHYDLAFHSNLSRSRDTLMLAMRNSHADAVIEDKRIRERCVGALEATPRYRPEPWKQGDFEWVPGGDGESYRIVSERCVAFLDDLAARATRPLRVVISTHAGVLRILDAILTRATDRRAILDRDIPNCTPFRYEVDAIPRTTLHCR